MNEAYTAYTSRETNVWKPQILSNVFYICFSWTTTWALSLVPLFSVGYHITSNTHDGSMGFTYNVYLQFGWFFYGKWWVNIPFPWIRHGLWSTPCCDPTRPVYRGSLQDFARSLAAEYTAGRVGPGWWWRLHGSQPTPPRATSQPQKEGLLIRVY